MITKKVTCDICKMVIECNHPIDNYIGGNIYRLKMRVNNFKNKDLNDTIFKMDICEECAQNIQEYIYEKVLRKVE